MKITRKKALALFLLFLLWPFGGAYVDRGFCCEERWQFHYNTLAWDMVLDRIESGPNEYFGINIMIPDQYCHEHVGGRTGHLHIEYIIVPGDTNLVMSGYGGDWWGDLSRFTYNGVPGGPGIANWCLPIWKWSSGKLERQEWKSTNDPNANVAAFRALN